MKASTGLRAARRSAAPRRGSAAAREIRRGVLLAVLLALLASGSPAGAGLRISLQPGSVLVEPSDEFTLTVCVDSAGSSFNGYEAVLRFDPFYVEFVSVHEETLMTDLCGTTWWVPEWGPDSVLLSHVALCGGLTLTGPGAVSGLTLRARTEGTTQVTFEYIEFYLGAQIVSEVTWQNATVVIATGGSGLSPDGPALGSRDPGAALHVTPNPTQGEVDLRFCSESAGPAALDLFDCSGRCLRPTQRIDWLPAGSHRLARSLRRGVGSQALTGPVFVRVSTLEGTWCARVLVRP